MVALRQLPKSKNGTRTFNFNFQPNELISKFLLKFFVYEVPWSKNQKINKKNTFCPHCSLLWQRYCPIYDTGETHLCYIYNELINSNHLNFCSPNHTSKPNRISDNSKFVFILHSLSCKSSISSRLSKGWQSNITITDYIIKLDLSGQVVANFWNSQKTLFVYF